MRRSQKIVFTTLIVILVGMVSYMLLLTVTECRRMDTRITHQ